VELSEIEAVVNEFPSVKDAVVVLWRQDGSETLVAYSTLFEVNRSISRRICMIIWRRAFHLYVAFKYHDLG